MLDFVLTGTSALGVSIASDCEVGVGMFFTLVHLYSSPPVKRKAHLPTILTTTRRCSEGIRPGAAWKLDQAQNFVRKQFDY